jgi:hypothetical protein
MYSAASFSVTSRRPSDNSIGSKKRRDQLIRALPLRLEEFSQPSRIRAELVPSLFEPPHAIFSVLADALRVDLPHGDRGIDRPDPSLSSAAAVLESNIRFSVARFSTIIPLALWQKCSAT